MYKFSYVVGFIMYFSSSIVACAQERIQIDANSKQRTICNLTFDNVPGVVIDAKKIKETSLRSRVNNERYDACPYTIDLKYKGQSIRFDFSKAFTLENVTNYDPATTVNTGYFVLDENGWHGESESDSGGSTKIDVKQLASSQVVSGVIERKDVNSHKTDYCVAVAAIGAAGFASGGKCSPHLATLAPLVTLLSGRPLVWFDK